jgi:hypothetical protein
MQSRAETPMPEYFDTPMNEPCLRIQAQARDGAPPQPSRGVVPQSDGIIDCPIIFANQLGCESHFDNQLKLGYSPLSEYVSVSWISVPPTSKFQVRPLNSEIVKHHSPELSIDMLLECVGWN